VVEYGLTYNINNVRMKGQGGKGFENVEEAQFTTQKSIYHL
jgi:hypothetical protein